MLRTTLAAVIAVLAIAATTPEAQAQTTRMDFCNRTGEPVYVAMVYVHPDRNQWYHFAWEKIFAGNCHTVGGVVSGLVYYYAITESKRTYWPDERSAERFYCYPNRAVNRPMSPNCESGESTVGYDEISVYGASHTVNLNPF